MRHRKEFQPQMHAVEAPTNRLSEHITGCALAHELRESGLAVTQQQGIAVHYDGVVVGEYVVDLLVERTVIVELKAIKTLDSGHAAQCINYLKASSPRLCLLLNFGKPRLEIQRFATGI